jgi:hypothetical protein
MPKIRLRQNINWLHKMSKATLRIAVFTHRAGQ